MPGTFVNEDVFNSEVRLHLTVGVGSESDYLAGESNVRCHLPTVEIGSRTDYLAEESNGRHHLFTVQFSSESDYLTRESNVRIVWQVVQLTLSG